MAIVVGNPGAIVPSLGFGAAVGTAFARGVGDRLAALFSSKAMDAAQGATIAYALREVTDTAAKEIERYIDMITPYATKGYYTCIICCALYMLKSLNTLTNGLVSAGLRATILGILRLGKSLASMTVDAMKKFAQLSVKLLKYIYNYDASGAIKEGARRLANAIGHGIKTVKEAATRLKAMAAQAKAGVMVRLRSVASGVASARARLAKYRANRAVKAKLAKNQAELKKIISKVRKTGAPLTAVEKKRYLAYAHKANQNAQKAARAAAASPRARNAANALKTMAGAKRKRTPATSPSAHKSKARVIMVNSARPNRSL